MHLHVISLDLLKASGACDDIHLELVTIKNVSIKKNKYPRSLDNMINIQIKLSAGISQNPFRIITTITTGIRIQIQIITTITTGIHIQTFFLKKSVLKPSVVSCITACVLI